MKLEYLRLKNFRQYLGEHLITFAGTDSSQNVTLIRGANGYGKTGIFRAIMFCLYSDKALDQDNLSPLAAKHGLTLVNELLLDRQPGTPTTASVELAFTDNGEHYVVKREIQGCKNSDGEIAQQDGPVSLEVRTSSGDTKPLNKDKNEIDARINQILPSRLRDFFLFDGERMEKLTRPGDEQKGEIKRGIRTLLQLDTLEQAIKALKKQEDKLTQLIRVNSSSELEAITERKLKVDQEIISLEADLDLAHQNSEIVDKEISQIETKLNENQQSVLLQQKRHEVTNQISEKETLWKERTKQLRSVLATLAPGLAYAPVAELYADLNGKVERGELPSEVKEEFIQGLLQNQLCICGTHLAQGSKEQDKIRDYLSKKGIPGQDELVQLCIKLAKVQQLGSDKNRQFEEAVLAINSSRDEIETLQKSLQRIEEELGDSKDLDVQKLATLLKQFKQDKATYERKIGSLEPQIHTKKQEGIALDDKIDELSKKSELTKEYQRQRAALKASIDCLKQVSNRYTTVVRDKLAHLASAAFKKMASEETLESLTGIVITDDFHLEVENALGRPMLSQISSGQRQIVSLAYICALIEACGNLEMPLLMDTPLGRLSGAHRDGCLNFLPSKTSQWIMLGTDTEIQEEEAEALRGSGKFGKVFEIDAVEMFHSKLKEFPVATWQPVRTKAKVGV
ncbi:MAG: AAA family ATPase [Candidatus Obscuribacterales bacterium]|nr:AAA family ATPase [Candidatus Obscuribacterales bacterium]